MQNVQMRYLGAVESFDDEKGYGFIRSGNGTEVVVSFRDLDFPGFKTLKPWQVVSFAVRRAPNGRPAASNVLIEDQGFAWP